MKVDRCIVFTALFLGASVALFIHGHPFAGSVCLIFAMIQAVDA